MKGYYNLSNKIGEKIFESENKVIKAVRDYSVAFANAMSEAESMARYGHKLEEGKNQEQGMKEEEVTDANLK